MSIEVGEFVEIGRGRDSYTARVVEAEGYDGSLVAEVDGIRTLVWSEDVTATYWEHANGLVKREVAA